jgi:hypothetical protein
MLQSSPTPLTLKQVLASKSIHRHPLILLGVGMLIAGLAVGIADNWVLGVLLIIIGSSMFVWLISNTLMTMNGLMYSVLGDTQNWPVHTRFYPLYKMVDITNAARTFAKQQNEANLEVRSAHAYPLAGILSRRIRREVGRLAAPIMISRKVAYDQELSLAMDTFWLIRSQLANGSSCVIRVWLPRRDGYVHLEVAAPNPGEAEQIIEHLGELAIQHSIYRGKIIRVVFDPEVRGDYDDDESMEPMDLVFLKEPNIADSAIVLDDQLKTIVERTIIDFHQRRPRLMDLGLPGKRGVLFYGPPGTGKTYTCKYIAGRLEGCTTLVVTGHALMRMKSVCALARAFQPSLVLLEDVDLVFSSREINNYNTVLGEFIDQLDGFGDFDQVIFILTTNAIERIESAIKDRPGRVSQCIYFGPPNASLRRRYLEALLQPYTQPNMQLDRIVSRTEGVSQAFLKELVFRAVQIASLGTHVQNNGHVELSDLVLEEALHEMVSGSDRYTQRIIGFRIDGTRERN